MRYVQINHRRISAAFLHSGAEFFVATVQMLRGKTRSTQGHLTLRFHERPLDCHERIGHYRPHERSAGSFAFGLGLVALVFNSASAPWLIPVIQFK